MHTLDTRYQPTPCRQSDPSFRHICCQNASGKKTIRLPLHQNPQRTLVARQPTQPRSGGALSGLHYLRRPFKKGHRPLHHQLIPLAAPTMTLDPRYLQLQVLTAPMSRPGSEESAKKKQQHEKRPKNHSAKNGCSSHRSKTIGPPVLTPPSSRIVNSILAKALRLRLREAEVIMRYGQRRPSKSGRDWKMK